jgi:hypothetical protein
MEEHVSFVTGCRRNQQISSPFKKGFAWIDIHSGENTIWRGHQHWCDSHSMALGENVYGIPAKQRFL